MYQLNFETWNGGGPGYRFTDLYEAKQFASKMLKEYPYDFCQIVILKEYKFDDEIVYLYKNPMAPERITTYKKYLEIEKQLKK